MPCRPLNRAFTMTCLRDGGKRSVLPELPSRAGASARPIPASAEGRREPRTSWTLEPGGPAARRQSRTPERKTRSPEPGGPAARRQSRTPERKARTPDRLRSPAEADAEAERLFLQLACGGDAEALALLLRRTPMLCTDNAGVVGTAVLYAAKNLDLATFKVLYTYGADTNVHDALAQSWEDKARASGRAPEEIEAFLKQATFVAGPSSKNGVYLVPFRRQRQR